MISRGESAYGVCVCGAGRALLPLRSSLRAAFTASPQRLRLFPPHPALSAGPGLTKCERKRRLSFDHAACRGQLEAATGGRLQPFSIMFHRPRNVCTCWSSHCHMDDLWEDVLSRTKFLQVFVAPLVGLPPEPITPTWLRPIRSAPLRPLAWRGAFAI